MLFLLSLYYFEVLSELTYELHPVKLKYRPMSVTETNPSTVRVKAVVKSNKNSKNRIKLIPIEDGSSKYQILIGPSNRQLCAKKNNKVVLCSKKNKNPTKEWKIKKIQQNRNKVLIEGQNNLCLTLCEKLDKRKNSKGYVLRMTKCKNKKNKMQKFYLQKKKEKDEPEKSDNEPEDENEIKSPENEPEDENEIESPDNEPEDGNKPKSPENGPEKSNEGDENSRIHSCAKEPNETKNEDPNSPDALDKSEDPNDPDDDKENPNSSSDSNENLNDPNLEEKDSDSDPEEPEQNKPSNILRLNDEPTNINPENISDLFTAPQKKDDDDEDEEEKENPKKCPYAEAKDASDRNKELEKDFSNKLKDLSRKIGKAVDVLSIM